MSYISVYGHQGCDNALGSREETKIHLNTILKKFSMTEYLSFKSQKVNNAVVFWNVLNNLWL